MSSRRLNFTVTSSGNEILEAIQSQTNQSISEIMRDAIKFYKWAQDESHAGKIILSRYKDSEPGEGETRILF